MQLYKPTQKVTQKDEKLPFTKFQSKCFNKRLDDSFCQFVVTADVESVSQEHILPPNHSVATMAMPVVVPVVVVPMVVMSTELH